MSSTSLSLVVMAAGMGSRYGGLKQVEPFGPGGETLLDYSVYDARRAGFDRVVFIIRRDFEAIFRERVGRRFEARMAVEYVFQGLEVLPGGHQPPPGREKPWGTGHAIWCAAGAVTGPFTAINADDFYGRDAFVRMAAFLRQPARATSAHVGERFAMAGYRLADTLSEHGSVSRGVCRAGADGRLLAIEEITGIEATGDGSGRAGETNLPADTPVSMNCWGFSPAIFPLLGQGLERFLAARGDDPKSEYYLPAAVAAAIEAGVAEVEVLPVRARWFGVTHRDDKPRVVAALSALVSAGDYPVRLWA